MRCPRSGWLILILIPAIGCASTEPPPPIEAKVTVYLRPEGRYQKRGVADLPGPPEQESILLVMQAESAALEAASGTLTEEFQPSAASKAYLQYAEALQAIDTKDCPKNFQTAFKAYAKSCRQLGEALKLLPDQYKETEFYTLLRAAIQGKKGVAEALGGDVITAAGGLGQNFADVVNQLRLFGVEFIQ